MSFTGRADAGEGVEEGGDEGAIAETHDVCRIDTLDQQPRLVCKKNRGLAFADGVLRPAHRARRIHGHDLPDHQPIEEHSNGGELLLDSRLVAWPQPPGQTLFNVGGHVHRLDIGQLPELPGLTPVEKLAGGTGVGAARVRVADVGGKEF